MVDLNEFNKTFDGLRNKYTDLYYQAFEELDKIYSDVKKGERLTYIGDKLGTPNMKLYSDKIEICSGKKVSKTVYIEFFGLTSDSVSTVEQACYCMGDYLDKIKKEPEYRAEINYEDSNNEKEEN